jgi:hypothetical protein
VPFSFLHYDEAPPRRSTVLRATMPKPTSPTLATKVAGRARAGPPVEASALGEAVALAVAVALAEADALAVDPK